MSIPKTALKDFDQALAGARRRACGNKGSMSADRKIVRLAQEVIHF